MLIEEDFSSLVATGKIKDAQWEDRDLATIIRHLRSQDRPTGKELDQLSIDKRLTSTVAQFVAREWLPAAYMYLYSGAVYSTETNSPPRLPCFTCYEASSRRLIKAPKERLNYYVVAVIGLTCISKLMTTASLALDVKWQNLPN